MEQFIAVEKFVARIKQKYSERRLNSEKQWPPCKSEKLVRLELVEGEHRQGYFAFQTRGMYDKNVKRSPLAYSEILKAKKGKKTVRKVLVEGDAGIGKTTLCMALSEDWANGKLFCDFKILLLLHLRQKRIASAASLLDLLKLLHPSQKVCELINEYIEEEEGKVLIIADGWDELSVEDRSEGSFLYELLLGECYSLSVIMTSRPYASAPLHNLPCIDKFVEVCGFSKDIVKEFILCEFASDRAKSSGLLEQLEGNPLIESVCSVPLNCAIICHLWHHLKGTLPTTMSELYTKIILNVVLRNIQKRPRYDSIPSLSHFDALPESLQQPWSLLCELAFQTLSEDRIVFSHEDLSMRFKNLTLNSEVFCFGLLQSAESILIDGRGVSFHFLHLTFQEYLAALYLVRQPLDKQLQLCWSYAGSKRFDMVWRFFFGISFTICNQSDNSNVAKVLIGYHTLYASNLCHFAFEAKQRSVDILITSKIKEYGPFLLHVRNAYDSAAVIHMIAHQHDYRCSISLSDCGLGFKQISALASALAGEHRKVKVSEMDLSGNKLTDQSVADLFDRASPAFSHSLWKVNLQNTMIGPKVVNSITTVLAKSLMAIESIPSDNEDDERDFEEYTELVLADNPLGTDGLRALSNALCADKLANLESLSLAGSLTGDADTNADLILALGSGDCHSLKELHLSRNSLGVPGGKALGKVLSKLRGLVSLYLNETKLGDDGISALIQNLNAYDTYCKLKYLGLNNNDIHAVGISYLAESICTGKISLIGDFFDILNNPLGLGGFKAIIRMLNSDHFKAFHIDLSGCQLATTGEISSGTNPDFVNAVAMQRLICSQEQQTNAVDQLWIGKNNFTGDGIHILATLMYVCPCRDRLYCQSCGITSDDLKQLLTLLSCLKLKLSYLWLWDLSNNDIDDNGVSALIQHLSMFPKLRGVFLDGNVHISSGMLETLKKKLYTPQEVHLHANLTTILKYNITLISCRISIQRAQIPVLVHPVVVKQ